MAKKNQQPLGEGLQEVGKSFKPDVGKFTTFAVGESHTGFFMGAKTQSIMDRRTRKPKEVFVIKIRDAETDEVKKLPAATMMLRAWEDIVDEYGDGDQNAAIQRLHGVKITLNRGDDQKTRDGNVIGSYEIIVFLEE